MNIGFTRSDAWCLLTEFTQSESLREHAMAVEACMRAYARKFATEGAADCSSDLQDCSAAASADPPASTVTNVEPSGEPALRPIDEEMWAITGLLHDFDYERFPTATEHPYKGNEILEQRGWPAEIRRAIMSHADYSGVTRNSLMEKTLFACDELSGFITAVALVKPSKSLAEVDVKSVRKRMKDKAFARSVSRDDIVNGAAQLGVDLDEHIAFCIDAMKSVANELGLAGVESVANPSPS